MFDWFKNHLLLVTILPLLVLSAAASYERFMVSYDYLVSHDGDCDPHSQSCFLYCEDDECSEPYYYSIVEREAHALIDMCGENMLECDDAYVCHEHEAYCVEIFCDPDIDGEACELLDESSPENT